MILAKLDILRPFLLHLPLMLARIFQIRLEAPRVLNIT